MSIDQASPVHVQKADLFRAPGEVTELDWTALAAHLSRAGLAFDPSITPRQFAGGFGNLNYLIQVDGRPCVLRRPPLGDIPPGANDMAREHRALSSLWRRFPLAPKSLHYHPDPDVIGAHFLIMEYRDGLVIGGKLPQGLDSRQVGPQLSEMLVRTLADLHAINPADVGLERHGRPDGFLERGVEGWAKRADIALGDETSPLVGDITDWLRSNLVADGAPTLLHCDFKLDNVILDPTTLAPQAVLDWDMSTLGDPLFDLATMLSYWTEAGDPACMHDLEQMPTAEPGFMTRSEIVDAYASQTGRDVSNFQFYRVLTLFKLAVVFLQIYARYRDGVVTDARIAGLGQLGPDLLAFAHDVAQGRAS